MSPGKVLVVVVLGSSKCEPAKETRIEEEEE